MVTALLAMRRMPGRIVRKLEIRKDPAFNIGPPHQIDSGATERPYVEMEERG